MELRQTLSIHHPSIESIVVCAVRAGGHALAHAVTITYGPLCHLFLGRVQDGLAGCRLVWCPIAPPPMGSSITPRRYRLSQVGLNVDALADRALGLVQCTESLQGPGALDWSGVHLGIRSGPCLLGA